MMPREQVKPIHFSPNVGRGGTAIQSTPSVVPRKRKSSPQPKFYAVRVGYTPGVYLSWEECERNIVGFKNASCE